MARARNLKPGFFQNEFLAELGMEAQLLYAGLWTLADRAGRLEDRPLRIKSQIFPYYKVDVNAVLDQLHAGHDPFIQRYEVDGIRYIQIIKFEKHQNPHVKEGASTIPAPGKHSASTSLARPLPSSPIPQPLTPNLQPDAPPVQKSVFAGAAFEKIWSRYPKRLGRKEAEKHFKASVRNPGEYRLIEVALDNYKRYIHDKKIDEQFIKMGSTWFNNWRDWIEYTGGKDGTNGGTGISEYAAIAKRAREAMGVREPITPPRALSPGVRDLQHVPPKAETAVGGGLRGDVQALEIIRGAGIAIKPAGP